MFYNCHTPESNNPNQDALHPVNYWMLVRGSSVQSPIALGITAQWDWENLILSRAGAPASTPSRLSYAEKIIIPLLVNPNSEILGPQECRDIADYLFTIHDKFKHFHHGGVLVPAPHLSVLERAPTVGLDVIEHHPEEDEAGHLHQMYSLRQENVYALSHAVSKTAFQLQQIYGRITPMSKRLQEGADPYDAFRRCSMYYVDEPESVTDITIYTRQYQHLSGLQTIVGETQLWVAFTQLLCSLLVKAEFVACPGVRFFEVDMFRKSFLAVQAHNWYMELLGASDDHMIMPTV
ncbi:hypothetical protein BDV93DRAFT_515427 [Ceratobasidium sp. AG-I]|nr:hypothetical protein BDV93DRAFT_515427 [Ceratobasidium sp. AG-I]